MACLKLLLEAQAAGVTVTRDGDQLVVRGPRPAEAMARQLVAQKADVLAAVDRQACLDVWRRTLREIAQRWNTQPGDAPWLNEETDARLTAAVKEAILAGDLAATERAAGLWREAWTRLLGASNDCEVMTTCDRTLETPERTEVVSHCDGPRDGLVTLSPELRSLFETRARCCSAESLFAIVHDQNRAWAEREVYRAELHQRAEILYEEAEGLRERPNQSVWDSIDRRKSHDAKANARHTDSWEKSLPLSYRARGLRHNLDKRGEEASSVAEEKP